MVTIGNMKHVISTSTGLFIKDIDEKQVYLTSDIEEAIKITPYLIDKDVKELLRLHNLGTVMLIPVLDLSE